MTAVKRRSELLLAITRAIIYARVSKDEAGGRSVREQIASCEKDCEYEGWTVGLVLQDNGRGASRHSRGEREDFNKLPDTLRAGDVLVVWEPSRITRDMRVFGVFCDLMADRGVLLYYDDQIYDMNDDDDRNKVWQDILDAAKAAGKTRKRTLRALSANLDKLKPHGRLSPGYRIIRDNRGKSLGREPIPEQARLLRECAKRLLEDEPWSWYRVSKYLEPRWREVGGGGRMDQEDVRRILTNPFLFGFRTSGGEIVGRGKWQEILDPEWYPALKAFADSKKNPTVRGSGPKWWLTYIMRCDVCLEMGARGTIVHKNAPGTRSGDGYVCKKYNHIQRDLVRVDAYVEELLLRLLEHPETLMKLVAKDVDSRVSIEMEMEAIEELREERDRYVADARKTRMSAGAVAAYVVPLEDDIRAAQERIDALTMPIDPALKGAVGPDARARWFGTGDQPGYPLDRRREIVRAAFDIRLERVERRGRYSEVGVRVRPVGALAG